MRAPHIAIAAACAAAVVAGCGSDSGAGGASASGGGDIKIAIMASTTGPLSYYGTQAMRGWELALKDHGPTIAGKKVTYIKVLCTTPADCTAAATKAVRGQGAQVILGFPGSALALPISQQAARLKVPYMESASTVNGLVPEGKAGSIFRASANDYAFAGTSVELAIKGMLEKLGMTAADATAMVVNESSASNHDQGNLEEETLKKMGIKVIGREEYTSDTVDFGALAAKIRSKNPTILVNASYEPDNTAFNTALARQKFKAPIQVSSAGGNSDTLRDALGEKYVNGKLMTFYPDFSSNPKGAPGVEKFLSDYKATYNETPPTAHPLVYYSSATILFDVLDKAKGSTKLADFQKAIASMDEPEGTFPNGWGAKFSQHGENERAFTTVLQWQDGKVCTVAPPSLAGCQFETIEEAGG